MDNNYTCNCKHNSNSRDNEPCCRCDSRHTNADRIRNMSDEELMDTLFNSCLEYMHMDECPYAIMLECVRNVYLNGFNQKRNRSEYGR